MSTVLAFMKWCLHCWRPCKGACPKVQKEDERRYSKTVCWLCTASESSRWGQIFKGNPPRFLRMCLKEFDLIALDHASWCNDTLTITLQSFWFVRLRSSSRSSLPSRSHCVKTVESLGYPEICDYSHPDPSQNEGQRAWDRRACSEGRSIKPEALVRLRPAAEADQNRTSYILTFWLTITPPLRKAATTHSANHCSARSMQNIVKEAKGYQARILSAACLEYFGETVRLLFEVPPILDCWAIPAVCVSLRYQTPWIIE